jgi:hypothetical protein
MMTNEMFIELMDKLIEILNAINSLKEGVVEEEKNQQSNSIEYKRLKKKRKKDNANAQTKIRRTA